MINCSKFLPTEKSTLVLAKQLANCTGPGCVIYLCGPLGAGKTTFVRGYLRGLGYEGKVRSPTYTVVETYEIGTKKVVHIDCYRLAQPCELEYMGITEYFTQDCICLIEWPEKGHSFLPKADVVCTLAPKEAGREIHLDLSSDGAFAGMTVEVIAGVIGEKV